MSKINKVGNQKKEEIKSDKNTFEDFFAFLLKVPGIKVNRQTFIAYLFSKDYPDIEEKFLSKGPKKLGFSKEEISTYGDKIINKQSIFTTTTAFLAGLPGGLAMVGTIPADIIQFCANLIICIQKLLYVYGWKDFSQDNILLKKIFVVSFAVMLEFDNAEETLKKLNKRINSRFYIFKSKSKFLSKINFTSSLFISKSYNQLVKKLVSQLTKKQLAKLGAKAIPLIGGIVNSQFVYRDFNRMTHILKSSLDKMY